METIICNDFSLHMLSENCTIRIEKISLDEFYDIMNTENYVSCIGNKDIANKLGLVFNKSNIVLNDKKRLIVAKLINGDSINKDVSKSFEFYDIRYT